MKGTSKWMDPNTLTREQVKTHESRTKQIVSRSHSNPSSRPNGSVHISVDFHVVTDNAGNGGVSASRINAQIAVLNQAFAGQTSYGAANTPFRFDLNSVSHTRNSRWYNADYFTPEGKERLREMRRALHVGDATHLNMYTVGPRFAPWFRDPPRGLSTESQARWCGAAQRESPRW